MRGGEHDLSQVYRYFIPFLQFCIKLCYYTVDLCKINGIRVNKSFTLWGAVRPEKNMSPVLLLLERSQLKQLKQL